MEQHNLPDPELTEEEFRERLGSESGPRGEVAEHYDDSLAGGTPIGPLTAPNTTAPDGFGEYQPGYGNLAGGMAEDGLSNEKLPKEEC